MSGDTDRLIKVVLHGLSGPIVVGGEEYGMGNAVPMPGMGGLTDQQVSAVLSYVREAFADKVSPVTAAEVKAVRAGTAGRRKPWTADELR